MNLTNQDMLIQRHRDTAYKAGVFDTILGMILVTTVIGLVVAAIGVCSK